MKGIYHGCGGSTKNGNEGEDRDLAYECGHCFKDQHAIHIGMLQGQEKGDSFNKKSSVRVVWKRSSLFQILPVSMKSML